MRILIRTKGQRLNKPASPTGSKETKLKMPSPQITPHQLRLFTRIEDSGTTYRVLLENHCTVWDFTQHRVRYKTFVSLVAYLFDRLRHKQDILPPWPRLSTSPSRFQIKRKVWTYANQKELFHIDIPLSNFSGFPLENHKLFYYLSLQMRQLHGKAGTLRQWGIFKYLPFS